MLYQAEMTQILHEALGSVDRKIPTVHPTITAQTAD